MSNIKALRNRIKSVKSTQKITKAMRMVSASKLHRAKEASAFANSFRVKILSILTSAYKNLDDSELSPFSKSVLEPKEAYNKTIAVIYSSDRGLCGGFNSAMLRKLKKELGQYADLKLITIGKKLNDILAKNYNVLLHLSISEAPLSISSKLTELLIQELIQDADTQVITYFTKFKNTLTQIPTKMNLIPIEYDESIENNSLNVEFEGEDMIDKLVKLYLQSNFVANLFESKASEEASRMTAMDSATRNAGEMINKLTLKMNRTRQAQITKELIEVISGAEAV